MLAHCIDFYWVSRLSAKATSSGQKITMVSKQIKSANEIDIKCYKMKYTDEKMAVPKSTEYSRVGPRFQLNFC